MCLTMQEREERKIRMKRQREQEPQKADVLPQAKKAAVDRRRDVGPLPEGNLLSVLSMSNAVTKDTGSRKTLNFLFGLWEIRSSPQHLYLLLHKIK